MANLGAIGTNRQAAFPNADFTDNSRVTLRTVDVGHPGQMVMGERDDAVGNPAPSLRMDTKGKRGFRWPVTAQERTISVEVKQAANVSPRPRLVIKANAAIGIASDLESVAPSGTGWVTCEITFTPTGPGVIEIVMENRYNAQWRSAPCYWDNLDEDL